MGRCRPLYSILGQYSVRGHRVEPWRKTGQQVRFPARIKRFPGGYLEIMAAERPIFHPPGWELSHKWDSKSPGAHDGVCAGDGVGDGADANTADKGAATVRSIRRARARVREIALANSFGHFVTLTLSPDKIDRYDDRAIIRKLSTWADNQVRRRGLRYVLVPERHQDGAVHFHGFLAWDGPVDNFVDSGTIKRPGIKKPRRPASEAQREEWLRAGGVPVFNLPSWSLGFSTAIPVYGDYAAAVAYCCKYIGKDMEGPDAPPGGADAPALGGKIGGRWYYSGGRLRKPEVSYADLTVDAVADLPGGYQFSIPDAAMGMALWRGREADLRAPMASVENYKHEAN